MQTKIVLGFLALIIYAYAYELGKDCSTKALLNENALSLSYSTYANIKLAYNGVASCESLNTDYNHECCYMKIKFKNTVADEKFTHRGCIEISGEDYSQIKTYRNNLEDTLIQYTPNISKVDIDIDCNSKIIKLTGLIFLAFLL